VGVRDGRGETVGIEGKDGRGVAVSAVRRGGAVGVGDEAGLAKPGKLQARAARTKDAVGRILRIGLILALAKIGTRTRSAQMNTDFSI
jgi:hypothetical protein